VGPRRSRPALLTRARQGVTLLLLVAVVACGHGAAAPRVQIRLVDGTPAPANPDPAPQVAAQPSTNVAPPVTVTGAFRIAVPVSNMPAVEPALQTLAAENPRLKLTVTPFPDAEAVSRSGLDLGIGMRMPGQPMPEGAVTILRSPLAIALPLTRSPDDLTLPQAVGVLSGTVTDWQTVGGAARPLRLAITDPGQLAFVSGLVGRTDKPPAGPRVADAATLLSEVDAGADEAVVVPWAGSRLHSKALRIDGRLPSDQGYPLQVETVLSPLHREAQPLAAQLGAGLLVLLAPHSDGSLSIDAMGDVMLARGVAAQVQRHNVEWPFAAVAERLRGSDVRFANLELALTERGQQAHKDYTFRAPPGAVQSLSFAGITVADVSNNHILDYGPQGLLDTLQGLSGAGVLAVGAGSDPEAAHRPAITIVNGVRIACLAYVNVPDDSITGFVARSLEAGPGKPGVAWGTPEIVRRDVQAARGSADIVIVALHAGFEYTSDPNTVQRDLAHAAIDAGAALVLGAHPHVLQGIEFYHGGVIAYSLGNFVFDLDESDRSHLGLPSVLTAVLRLQLDSHGVTGIEVYPAIINSIDFRPEPVAGEAARPVYDRLWKLTDSLNPR
jgi:poly-gamma-glutamate capsule biosynthesis protein CapA/YwtB (metallophosphatase superfamily)